MSKFKLGILLTIIWLTLLAFIVINQSDLLNGLSLNEWGDFLAGTFSPIAFLWLVLGYIQQGKELKENTRTLELQKQQHALNIELSAYVALIGYENSEVNLLNKLGEQFKEGAINARNRAKEHKDKIDRIILKLEKL